MIMYEGVDMTELSHEMLECLETESFLNYQNDETESHYFWQTLKQSLPTKESVTTVKRELTS